MMNDLKIKYYEIGNVDAQIMDAEKNEQSKEVKTEKRK